jgi:acyl-CoA reductase-like NAD-dependent aldehyde dehydrogenase
MKLLLYAAIAATALASPAYAQPSPERVATLEEAGMAAIREIDGVIYTIENREDGGPVDNALVARLNAAVDALYEVVSDGQFICDEHPERCRDEPAPKITKGERL